MSTSVGPFRINGTPIPTPSTYDFGIEDLSSEATGRTMDGIMHKDIIAVKDYYACTWKHLSWGDIAIILNAINGQSQVTFTYADPRIPYSFVTGDFYVGQRGGAALDLSQLEGRQNWTNLKLTFTRI